MSIKYFKTYTEAAEIAKKIPDSFCINKYQQTNECKFALVREFLKGYAVQLGDYGDYATLEFVNNLKTA